MQHLKDISCLFAAASGPEPKACLIFELSKSKSTCTFNRFLKMAI